MLGYSLLYPLLRQFRSDMQHLLYFLFCVLVSLHGLLLQSQTYKSPQEPVEHWC